MDIIDDLRKIVIDSINQLVKEHKKGELLDFESIVIEIPKGSIRGDYSTNAAMIIAKDFSSSPKDIGEELKNILMRSKLIDSVSLEGPGFLNIILTQNIWTKLLSNILLITNKYGKLDLGKKRKVNVEFVSANPTGPLHIGHVRGAIFGDALSRLLEYTGFIVTKEYYVNDGGAQIDVLGRTLYHRYLELQGDIADLPDEAYPGDYLVPVATALHEKYGDSLITMGVEERHALVCEFGILEMMQLIKNDLKSLDILMDNYFSEKMMIESGQIEKAIRVLEKKNLIYRGVLEAPKGKLKEDWKSREQILFKSTQFGDDMDRPIKKSDGSWTYFAPDLAYHGDKLNRKYDLIVDVLGADHSGYVNRIEAVVKAISSYPVDFKVKLIQLVRLLKNKKPLKMSKRSGDYIMIDDLLKDVSSDVIRFVMLSRKNDVPLDFDIDLILDKSKDNPVFYVNYAHARIHSILSKASQSGLWSEAINKLEMVTTGSFNSQEIMILIKLSEWPNIIRQATRYQEPHRISYYLYELSSLFHSLYQSGEKDDPYRFIIVENKVLSLQRLCLAKSIQIVIKNGLQVLGIVPLKEMY